MKSKLAGFVSLLVLLLLLGAASPASAKTQPYSGIGVTGVTRWMSEYHESLTVMQSFGIPIHDGCLKGDICVHLDHYRANDGQVGYSTFGGRSETWINDFYDNGTRMQRLHTFVHEMGHQAGLDHSSSCGSSMYPTIPACGYYVVGYDANDLKRLRELWG